MNQIKYKPHRGHLQPVGEVRKSDIILHDNFLELVYDYDYTEHLGAEENRTAAILIAKKDLSISLTVWYHEDDREKKQYPQIELYINGSYCEYIYIESMDEAETLYKQIKTWLLK